MVHLRLIVRRGGPCQDCEAREFIEGEPMRKTFAVCVPIFVVAAALTAAHGQSSTAATTPADQACDAQKLSTNDYEDCLQKAETAIDTQLSALIASIPSSAKVKSDIVGPDVAASAVKRWQTNFATLAPTFRAARNADCDDGSIAAMGYGNGGLQWRLACEINQTSREIAKLKKRYGLN